MSFDQNNGWRRLAAAARQAPDDRDGSAPFGFSTRVAALAMAQRPAATSWISRLSLRAMIVACALAVGAIGVHLVLPQTSSDDGAASPSDDPVAQVVDFAS